MKKFIVYEREKTEQELYKERMIVGIVLIPIVLSVSCLLFIMDKLDALINTQDATTQFFAGIGTLIITILVPLFLFGLGYILTLLLQDKTKEVKEKCQSQNQSHAQKKK